MEALKSEPPHAAKYPIDTDAPLHPTKVLYLQPTSGRSISMVDITSSVLPKLRIDNAPIGEATSLFVAAKAACPTAQTVLQFQIRNGGEPSPSHLSIVDPSSDTLLAELSSKGLLSFGPWTVTFPLDSPYSSHDITLQPVGLLSVTDWCTKDSIPYFWDMHAQGGRRVGRLFKAKDGKRIEVGGCFAERVRDKYGVFAFDDQAVGKVVACATLVAAFTGLSRSGSEWFVGVHSHPGCLAGRP
jgi:hypothetical protein